MDLQYGSLQDVIRALECEDPIAGSASRPSSPVPLSGQVRPGSDDERQRLARLERALEVTVETMHALGAELQQQMLDLQLQQQQLLAQLAALGVERIGSVPAEDADDGEMETLAADR